MHLKRTYSAPLLRFIVNCLLNCLLNDISDLHAWEVLNCLHLNLIIKVALVDLFVFKGSRHVSTWKVIRSMLGTRSIICKWPLLRETYYVDM